MLNYSAKKAYTEKGTAENYERLRFSGFLGRHRYKREQRAVERIVTSLPSEVSILDLPCGTGRWWRLLSSRASSLIAMDVSEEMLVFARARAKDYSIPIDVVKGDAENIDLPENSVDYVFSHALTKHLPIPIQYQVLAEFGRVARRGVISSFGIFNHLTYEFWRRRKLVESYPILREELEWMAEAAGLEIERTIKCTTFFGVEHTVLFRKRSVP